MVDARDDMREHCAQQMEDLCPFHDLANDYGDCTCGKAQAVAERMEKHRGGKPQAKKGGRPQPKRVCEEPETVAVRIPVDVAERWLQGADEPEIQSIIAEALESR